MLLDGDNFWSVESRRCVGYSGRVGESACNENKVPLMQRRRSAAGGANGREVFVRDGGVRCLCVMGERGVCA